MRTTVANEEMLTKEAYLTREAQAEMRSEFWKGVLFPMPGGSPEHGRIIMDVNAFLNQHLTGYGFEVWDGNTRVKVSDLGYAYPDGVIVVGKGQFLKEKGVSSLLNPALIIEVLSESTAAFDRNEKFEAYKTLPSFQEYLLVHQDRPLVEQFVRGSDNTWSQLDHIGPAAVVPMTVVPLALPLAVIYRFINF